MPHKKLIYLTTIALSLLFSGCKEDDRRPNIVFIISDDQSYTDYGFMGHQFIETPNIDKLARESLTFTRGYVTSPLCSPSLASIMTGLYAFQHGITGNDPAVVMDSIETVNAEGIITIEKFPVKRNVTFKKLADNYYKHKLLTQILSENGYISFQAGKWWLGSSQDGGFTKGMTHGDSDKGGRNGDAGLSIARKGLAPVYDFIEEADSLNKPFYLWYAPFLPHKPHNPPDYWLAKYETCAPSPSVAKYWAMVEWFDETTGELLDYLKQKGLDENTIIVYTGDNGWMQAVHSEGYIPKSKRAPHEGGIRTPIMFKYPDLIEPKMNKENLVSTIDIVPTILEILGIDKGTLPGIAVLDDQALNNRNVIFSESYEHDVRNVDVPTESLLYKIAIEKSWKLLVPNNDIIKKDATRVADELAGYYSKDIQLFNLDEDPFEVRDVAPKYPEEVARMKKEIDDWWKPVYPSE